MLNTNQLLHLSDELLKFMNANVLPVGLAEYLLINAAINGYPEIARICILAGANIHVRFPEDLNPTSEDINKTPLEIAQKYNHLDVAELLSTSAASNCYTIETTSPSPLPSPKEPQPLTRSSVQQNINDVIKDYCQTNASLSTDEQTVWNEILKYISEWENDTDALYAKIKAALTLINGKCAYKLLDFAITRGAVYVCQLCIEAGANLDSTLNNDGFSLFHTAAAIDNMEIVSLFMESNININSDAGVSQNTPLMVAAYCGSINVVKHLIQHGAKLNLQNRLKQTALTIAPSASEDKYVTALLFSKPQHDFKMRKAYNQPHQTNKLLAARGDLKYEHQRMVIAKSSREYIQQIAQNRENCLASWKAARHTPDGMNALAKLYTELDTFFSLDFNQEAGFAQEILFEAANHDLPELAKLCIKLGAIVNNTDAVHRTPLIIATLNSHYAVMEVLMLAGADPSIPSPNDKNLTPHSMSIHNADKKAIELLSKNDLNKKTTLCDIVTRHQRLEAVHFEIQKKVLRFGPHPIKAPAPMSSLMFFKQFK